MRRGPGGGGEQPPPLRPEQSDEARLVRRDFLTLVSAGVGGVVAGFPLSWSGRRSRSETGDTLFQAFRSPSAEARPFFRWWWNGNRVTREELIRELRLMHAVGAGGVEINPIGMHEAIPNPSGPEVSWLSDEWTALVAAVAEEAEGLGLVTDLIVGTGWPFGGEFLRDDEMIQGVELEVLDVEGPGRFARKVASPQRSQRRLLQATLFPAAVRDLAEGHDVTGSAREDGTLAFEVPAGAHRVYILTWRHRFRDVFLGAPGGAGPVLDHLNRPGWVGTPSAAIDSIRYSIWNKYASSAGHLNGRRVISSEAMTNTSGVFEASLGYIKQATDHDLAGGVNHLVLHGFNYSPPEAGRPGWMRFGAYFAEHNPWWPHAHRWFETPTRSAGLVPGKEDDGPLELDLGEVREISEVRLNGEPLGVRWYGRHRYGLSGRIRPGRNALEVTVTTLAYNHYRARRDDPMAQHWVSRPRREGPLPSGLLGPVRLLRRASEPGGAGR